MALAVHPHTLSVKWFHSLTANNKPTGGAHPITLAYTNANQTNKNMSTFDIQNSIHAAAYKLAASHFLSSTHEDWTAARLFAAIESDEDSDDWLTSELDRDQVYPWIGIEASCEDAMLDPWVRLQEYIVGLAEDFIEFRTSTAPPEIHPCTPYAMHSWLGMQSHCCRLALREGFIGDVAISHVTISIDGEIDFASLDLGSVTLSCNGREYKLDVVGSCWDVEEGCTEITADLTTMDEDDIFEDCPFDLTAEDLFSSDLTGAIFVGEEGGQPQHPMTATLFVERDGCTRAIELAFE